MIDIFRSPIGIIILEFDQEKIMGLNFADKEPENLSENQISQNCKKQLDGYFRGTLLEFDLKIYQETTEFSRKVYAELLKIPYGEVRSYSDVARGVGSEKAVRAVGNANNHNNISIIVPCHRVIGKNGSLTGYGGGLWRKDWLLEHEKSVIGRMEKTETKN